jgi:hypothetical protein
MVLIKYVREGLLITEMEQFRSFIGTEGRCSFGITDPL